MFSFVLAMSAAFLAAPAIASDVETGTVHAMLARPLRRADLRASGAGSGCRSSSPATPCSRACSRSPSSASSAGTCRRQPLVAVGFLAFQAIVVLTLALALGTRLPAIAAGAITVVLFGLGWFAGVLGSIALAFDAAPLARAGRGRPRDLLPTDGLWRGVVYGLEPPLVLLLAAGREPEAIAANPFFADAPPPPRSSPGPSLGRPRAARGDRPVPPPGALGRRPARIGVVSNRFERSGRAAAGLRAL